MKTPAYLTISRHGVYYARFLIPPRLQKNNDNLGREVRISLHTRVPKEARVRVRWLHIVMDRWVASPATHSTHPVDILRSAMAKIRRTPPDVMQWDLVPQSDGLYAAKNIKPGEGAEAAEELEKLNAKALARRSLAQEPSSENEIMDPSRLARGAHEPISKHVEEWLLESKQRPKANSLTDKTIEGRAAKLAVFIDYFDNKAIGTLTAAQIQRFEADLSFYPARKDVLGILPGFSAKQAIDAMKIGGVETEKGDSAVGLSDSTRGHYMSDIRQFLRFAISRLVVHPTVVAINENTKPSASGKRERELFTHQDLQAIFQHPFFHDHWYSHPYQYWIPLLALYSGARISELAQLSVSDISHENAHWMVQVLDLTETDEKASRNKQAQKTLKNDASRRKFPVHPTVLKLGFIQFVEQRKAEGHLQLFDLKFDGRDGAGQRPSRWFNNEFLRPIVGITDPKKVFHSFRHTVITALGNSIANENNGNPNPIFANVLRRIAGHSIAHTITDSRGDDVHESYMDRYDAATLMRVIEMLDWPIKFAPFRWPDAKNAAKRKRQYLRQSSLHASDLD